MILLLESRILNVVLQESHTSSQNALGQISTHQDHSHGNSRILHMPLILYSTLQDLRMETIEGRVYAACFYNSVLKKNAVR